MSGPHKETGNLPHGWMLGQRYLIVAQVGQGGMGAVYKAVDTFVMPRKAVAIKEMSQANLSGTQLTDAKNQFQREADLLKSLSHSNLPQFYNTFEENGRFYLVMEFIEGKTLQKLLDEVGGKPLPAS